MDIFEKDFLIVPINKNAHWYLAIVCYPYLTKPVYAEDAVIAMDSDAIASSESSMSADDSNDSDTFAKREQKQQQRERDKADNGIVDLIDDPLEEVDEADADSSMQKLPFKLNAHKTCIKMPAILIFDSLSSCKRARVIATLKE